MTQILGTIKWGSVEYLRVLPSDPELLHCSVCHFQHLVNDCPDIEVKSEYSENLCIEAHGGGCFVTQDELIKLKLKGVL